MQKDKQNGILKGSPKRAAQLRAEHGVNGNFRNLNWRYLPYLKPIFYAYVREYPPKIWRYMVQYLHFRILKFPLMGLLASTPYLLATGFHQGMNMKHHETVKIVKPPHGLVGNIPPNDLQYIPCVLVTVSISFLLDTVSTSATHITRVSCCTNLGVRTQSRDKTGLGLLVAIHEGNQ